MDIRKLDRTALKSYFVKNAIPTASNFADFIDGVINQKEDGIVKLPGEPLSVQAYGDDTTLKKAINLYKNFADPKPAWTLSLNPRVDPNNPATAKPGWSIGDADGNSKLFIDQTTGNIGVGTVEPGGYKLNVNGPALFTGTITPSAGGTENTGIMFPKDPGGGGLDAAWIRYYARQGEACTLELGVSNDADDHIALMSSGNVGIGTTAPRAKLEVNGGVYAGNSDIYFTRTDHDHTGIGNTAGWAAIENSRNYDSLMILGRAGTSVGRKVELWDYLGVNGTCRVSVLQLGDKWRLSGVGDGHGNDDWLRLFNAQNTDYRGGLAASRLWSSNGTVERSDSRLKSEVSALRQALENILKLRGVRFKWRDAADTDPHAFGLIAQEVEEVFPEVVSTGPDAMKGINYSALIAPLIEAVKQQQAQIGELRAEIQALRTN